MSVPVRFIARLDHPIPEVTRGCYESHSHEVTFTLSDRPKDTRRVVSITMDWDDALRLAREIRRSVNEKAKAMTAALEES